jgi:hypothetical protein
MSRIVLPVISAISPTFAETMRLCQLRAGLSKAIGSFTFVLGNPKGWLGTAYHEVLEKIAGIDFKKESVDGAVDRLWKQAVAVHHQRSSHHPLDFRFGAPETWPGFYLARASVLLRARELVAGLAAPAIAGASARGACAAHGIREREFTAFDGRLVGRPDVIRDCEVVDYKSGTIFEFGEAAQADVVKAAYLRQLHIYGFLVKETLGWWPQRGLLLPLAGAGVEIALDPDQCTREAEEAVALLDGYNGRVSASTGLKDLASPSAQHCRWCPYKIICPPFWQTASPEWSGQLDGIALEGVAAEPPCAIYAGEARAIFLDVENGSIARSKVQMRPLNPVTHPAVITLAAGERIRAVGLRTRRDGVLVPGDRTVIFRVDGLPSVGKDEQTKGISHDA